MTTITSQILDIKDDTLVTFRQWANNTNKSVTDLRSLDADKASNTYVNASFQPIDPKLTAISGAGSSADKLFYYTGSGSGTLTNFTSFARTLLNNSNAGGMLSTLTAAPLNSPSLTGTPTAPTADPSTNSTQLATTAYVTTAISNLINASPSALDTLSELATALGNDANFATTMSTALGNRVRVDATQSFSSSQKKTARDNISSGYLPIGFIGTWSTSTAPSEWLLCQGQAVSRSTYSALFAVIGTTYGSGNGTTTFNLPDMRGRVVAGVDAGAGRLDNATLGATMGSQTQTLTIANLPSHSFDFSGTTGNSGNHNHTFSGTTSTTGNHSHTSQYGVFGGGTGPTTTLGGPFPISFGVSITNTTGDHNHTYSGTTSDSGTHNHSFSGTTSSLGSGTAHNNLQPTIVMNFIIYCGVAS